MPLAAEQRIFWLDGAPVVVHDYWDELAPVGAGAPLEALAPIAAGVPSRFFTMDVARLDDGGWTIVELGDGQVAGLPSAESAAALFNAFES